MLKNFKVNQLVPLGFAIIVLVTAITSIFTKITTNTLLSSVEWVNHTYKVKADLKEIENLLLDAETGQRGYIYTGNISYLAPYDNAIKKLENSFDDLNKEIKDNPAQLNRLNRVRELSSQKLDELATTINLKRQGKEPEVRALVLSGKGRQLMINIRERLAEMAKAEDQLLGERQKSASQAQNVLDYWTLGSILTIIVIGVLISLAIARILKSSLQNAVAAAEKVAVGDLTNKIQITSDDEIGKLLTAFNHMTQNLNSLIRQVQQSGIQITTSTTQIAASSKQLEASVTQQVASTNEVVATTREIAANSAQLVKTMDEVTDASLVTANAASDGQKDLMRMQATMRKLADATSSISSKLGVISEKANNINSIVTTITKVADQTNLLSLNAAIEAEKAREYGLGFAVVAREIRRLADQTAVATLDIESMVKEMQSAVASGVMEMDKFSKEVSRGVEDVGKISMQLGLIIEQVQALTPSFESVSQGMEAQSQGAQQISEAMLQLREASTQTADALRETNRAIEQLNDAAQKLRVETSGFKLSN